MTSLAEENYLKAIFHLESQSPDGVSTNALAEDLDAKASSATEMLKKLAAKDLVRYRKYQGVKLSETGKRAAIDVIRRHRLWEYFLVEKLNFNWSEVHEVAEQLEHIQSPKLISELDKFLNYPRKDPHGDPIPDKDGSIVRNPEKKLLSTVETGKAGFCVGVVDSSKTFLQYLNRMKISLGTQIEVVSREAFDNSMWIRIDDHPVNISETVSNNLYIKEQDG